MTAAPIVPVPRPQRRAGAHGSGSGGRSGTRFHGGVAAGGRLDVGPARTRDAATVATIQRRVWLDTYPSAEHAITVADLCTRLDGDLPGRWRRQIGTCGPRRQVFVARHGQGAVGFAAVAVAESGRHWLGALYVLAAAQGRGVGSALLDLALGWHGCSDVYADVAAYNTHALAFYDRHGFEAAGEPALDLTGSSMGLTPIPLVRLVHRVD